jgi:hypothetical protein
MWLILLVLTIPISNLLMEKGMMLDMDMPDDKKYHYLSIIFYIPFVNVVFMFCYLVWQIIRFKRS